MKDNYSEDVVKTLEKIANKSDNKFSRYIDGNEPTKAGDVAISVLSLVESSKSQVSQHLLNLSLT